MEPKILKIRKLFYESLFTISTLGKSLLRNKLILTTKERSNIYFILFVSPVQSGKSKHPDTF